MRAWIQRWGVALLALASLTGFAADAATIVGVSPQGEVAQVRQLAVTFSEAVAAFGDPRLPDPMAVSCVGSPTRGAGLWTSDRSWVFNFELPLPPGVRCLAQVRPDWKPRAPGSARSETALTGATSFAFSTGGPAVESIQPDEGATIEEDQHFLLTVNGAATDRSVATHAWCEVEGLGDRLPVRIVTGALRDRIASVAGPRPLKDAKREAERQSRLVVLACPRPLPTDTPMRLVWGRGIAAAVNPDVATRVEQRFGFRVRPAFTAEFSCERERATAPCLPIRPLVLRFSAPIDRKLAELVRLVPAGGKPIAPAFDKDDKDPEVSSITLAMRVAENAAFTVEVPPNLKDAAGRGLANAGAFPMKVSTVDAPPIARFSAAPFGIFERYGEAASPGAASSSPPMLPLTLRHVQGDLRPSAPTGSVRVKRLQTDAEMLAWYDKLHRFHESELSAQEAGLPKAEWFTSESRIDGRGRTTKHQVERRVQTRTLSLLKSDATARRLDLPQLKGGDPRPFEVVGLPLAEPGYHVVEIESARLGQALLDPRAPMYVRTGVLVTNLGVHVKLGRENSAVWVTSLDRGRPVEGADVAINDCLGKRLWAGRTDARGLAIVKLALDLQVGECPNEAGYFVTARKADADPRAPQVVDTAFVFTSWQKGIEPWRFNLPTSNASERDAVAHTVFDRTLLRAGETVSMKHFLRAETSAGLAPWDAAALPTRVKIVHQGSGQQIVQPLVWNGTRHAVSTWNIPPAAKLGLYEVMLERDVVSERQRGSWTSGSFRVEEFRLPLIDARLSGPSQVPIAPRELPLSVQMGYLSGGAMAKSPAAVSALLKPRVPAFPGHDGFSFEPPREMSPDGEPEDEADTAQRAGRLVADKLPLLTDAQGAATLLLKDLPPLTRASELHSELTYADPNGEVQTVSTRIDLWPSAVVLGIKTRSWASQRGGRVQFNVLALDTRGQPIRGQRVEVRGRLSQTLSNRTRIVGGFYAYDNRTELKDIGVVCSGSTDERGGLACDATLSAAGQVELIAQAKDEAGRVAQAATSVWITKQG
ncbi:MAG: MG2 domain-containing protein [Rhizobacter sp.]